MSVESSAERPARCSLSLASGDPCGQPATIYDEQHGAMVCQGHAPRGHQIQAIRGAIARLRTLIFEGRYKEGIDQARALEELVARLRERLLWEEGLVPRGHV